MITGQDLIEMGFKPGNWFREGIDLANKLAHDGLTIEQMRPQIAALAPGPGTPLRDKGIPFHVNIKADGEQEQQNVDSVLAHMETLMRVPTVERGAIMPDACPSGRELGTIPVGGIVATRDALHPGFHSADICCSVAISILGDVDPKSVLDVAQANTHFGGGGRPRDRSLRRPDHVRAAFATGNKFLEGMESELISHFGSQGDGNHFLFVGRLRSTGEVALVTHHGSRKPGAIVYKRGMERAEKWRKKLSPETPSHSAWIPANDPDGVAYWEALQAIRVWTKASHFAIHDFVAEAIASPVKDRFWNEHNFVFKRDGLFYHAKGATPAWRDFAADSTGLTLIPLNMAEPILIARGKDADNGIGFSPHGAGRNASRTAYLRTLETLPEEEIIRLQTPNIDARFYSGFADLSELPLAYKNAASVRTQIEHFGLADVVDEVMPYGCIMAGDWTRDAPWKKKKVVSG